MSFRGRHRNDKLGIIGLGQRIGRQMAKLAKAFNIHSIAVTRTVPYEAEAQELGLTAVLFQAVMLRLQPFHLGVKEGAGRANGRGAAFQHAAARFRHRRRVQRWHTVPPGLRKGDLCGSAPMRV